ncbi:MAG TPA: hypothetical protein VLK33_08400 [Terriglobales bacterium]|nr:hypothetical protein [Terriglobales bacterium]
MKNKKLFSWLAHGEQPTTRKQHNNSPSWTSITVPRSLATNAAASIVVADILVGSESNVSSVPRMKIRSKQRLIDPGVNGGNVATGDGGNLDEYDGLASDEKSGVDFLVMVQLF